MEKIFKNIAVISFFVTYLLIGISIYDDYGVSWDEPIQRKYGTDVYNYVVNDDAGLEKNKDKYYGPVFETFLIASEKITDVSDLREIYFQRHLLTFLLFYVSSIIFYKLISQRFDSWWIGLIATLMLIISPRIFAHSFYNSKDIPLLSFFIISGFSAYKLVEEKSADWAVFHALITAFAIDIRVVGVLIIPLTFVYALTSVSKDELVETATLVLVYFVMVILLTFAFWPTLWANPYTNFINAINQIGNYPQSTSMTYFGTRIKSTNVPWHYILGWISVSAPVSVLKLFILGVGLFLVGLVKNFKNSLGLFEIYAFGWVFVPLVSVIILKSTLYDSWRQLFFIYPAIVFFAVFGLHRLLKSFLSKVLKITILILVLVDLTLTSVKIYTLHPFQNLYLNVYATEKFEQDYWGISYRKALEYIAKTDTREQILVRVENLPGITNANLLNNEDRKRLIVTEKIQNADYFVTNYRNIREEPPQPLYFSLEIEGERVIGVYKLN